MMGLDDGGAIDSDTDLHATPGSRRRMYGGGPVDRGGLLHSSVDGGGPPRGSIAGIGYIDSGGSRRVISAAGGGGSFPYGSNGGGDGLAGSRGGYNSNAGSRLPPGSMGSMMSQPSPPPPTLPIHASNNSLMEDPTRRHVRRRTISDSDEPGGEEYDGRERIDDDEDVIDGEDAIIRHSSALQQQSHEAHAVTAATADDNTVSQPLPSRTTVLAPSQVVLNNRSNAGGSGCRLGVYGWRRRCLYALLLFLTATVTLNLALTLFFMRVLDFSSTGLGALQIVRGGLVARGPVLVMDTLVATHVASRPNLPLTLLAAHNVTIAATDTRGHVTSSMVLSASSLSVATGRMVVKDPQGKLLFSASKEEVVIGARKLVVAGEGGAAFSGSVQTGHVSAPVGKSLLLESNTRSLGVSAPQGVTIESRAGSVTAHCLEDLTLQSTSGAIKLASSRVVVRGLPTSTVQSSNPANTGPDVYQVCVCSGGRLFLAAPGGVCAADHIFCK